MREPPPLYPAVLLCLLAVAATDGGMPDFTAPSADEYLLRGALAALLAGLAVKGLRVLFWRWLAPRPATPASKALTLLACLACGAVLGVIGTAPAVAAGLAGKVVGGLGTGVLAFFGAKALGSRLRGEGKARAKTDGAL